MLVLCCVVFLGPGESLIQINTEQQGRRTLNRICFFLTPFKHTSNQIFFNAVGVNNTEICVQM